jgi:hypothetical protein
MGRIPVVCLWRSICNKFRYRKFVTETEPVTKTEIKAWIITKTNAGHGLGLGLGHEFTIT